MMIAEEFFANDVKSPRTKIRNEGSRVADAAEGEEFFLTKVFYVGRWLPGTIDGCQLRAGVEDGCGGILANGRLHRGRVFGSGDDDDVGTSEGRARFAQATGGKQMAAAERIGS